MFNRLHTLFLAILITTSVARASSNGSWNGHLSDAQGKPLTGAIVLLHSVSTGRVYSATSTPEGRFAFSAIDAGSYELAVEINSKEWKAEAPLVVKEASAMSTSLQLTTAGQV